VYSLIGKMPSTKGGNMGSSPIAPSLFFKNKSMESEKFSTEEWNACLKVLNILKDSPFDNPENQKIKTLITAISKKAKKQLKKVYFLEKKEQDVALLKTTIIVANAENITSFYSHAEVANPSKTNDLQLTRKCYACNENYKQLHFFYHKLCPSCASFHYQYRNKKHDFSGYTVVITGGRVKIGYATVLKFLQSGASVIVTTRFPALALEQLQKEPDFDNWKHRLTVYGLDLRNLKAVQEFVDFCNTNIESLDILVNNAAQTIKYPHDYYKPLIQKEKLLLLQNNTVKLLKNVTPITHNQEILIDFDTSQDLKTNRFGQPIDYRDKNSWNAMLNEVSVEELLEVNLINHIAPYQLISGLKDLMKKSNKSERFIINVTSSEGQFSYPNKTVFHPHTNMTKAALNMLTRTSAKEFVADSIYMNSVDVGWISTGANESKRERLFENLQIPPLDSVDGAMRIIHPIDEIADGNKNLYGVLLKNYKVVDW
jgi:NAD(P)-dependent dehydrogenase (short-subunit alcohol dehydrogenase family)